MIGDPSTWASLKISLVCLYPTSAQHSVQPTSGILRDFSQFSTPQQNPAPSPPLPLPLAAKAGRFRNYKKNL